MALVVRADFHCDGSRRVKVNSRSPASSRLSATARHLSRHLELWLILGDAHHQAARFLVSLVCSIPSVNLIPSMTFGN
jgi:hypothetical protein